MALRIRRLRWRNAFIFSGDFSVEFPDKGLILLEGRNLDAGGSNGAGKTSFLNLLPTVLFEQNPSGLIKDKLINRNEKEALIELELDSGRILYKRGKTDSTWEFFKGNGVKLKGESLKDTKEIIKKEINLNYNQYISAVHLTQNSPIGFFILSGSERLRIISELLNLDRFDLAAELARTEANKINLEIEGLKGREQEIENFLNSIEEEYKKRKGDLASENLEVLKTDKDLKEKILEDLKEQRETLQKEIVSLENEISNVAKEKQRLQKEIQLVNIELGDLRLKMGKFKDIETEIKKLEAKLKNENDLRIKKEELEREYEENNEQLNEINLKIKMIDQQILEKQELLKLRIGEDCPVCGQRIIKEKFKIHQANITKEIENLVKEKESLFVKLDELKKVKTEVSIKLKNLEKEINELQEIKITLSTLRTKKEQRGELESQIKLREERLNEFGSKLNQIKNVEPEIIEKLQFLQSKKAELDTEIARENQNFLFLIKRITEEEKKRELLESMEVKITTMKTQQDELRTRIAEQELQLECYKWWQDGFKKFKILEISNAINIIQQYLNKYIELLFENRFSITLDVFKYKKSSRNVFDFKNELNITINDSDLPIEAFSGGEKQLMGLAMLLALNDFLGLNLILLDETFASLDIVNRERVLKLLEYLRDRKLIIVVTHIEEVKSALEWDAFFIVERRNGISNFSIERY